MSTNTSDEQIEIEPIVGILELHRVDMLMLQMIREILLRQLTHVQMAPYADANRERQIHSIKNQMLMCEHAIERSALIFGSKK